uniref:Uncharacterized protein n=1 Tax=Ascaris lumbricoides TaxID=6252 RepID=A0A9J2PAQ0_ASCLU
MLEFEVVPECCLRNEQVEFALGMPINQVITMLQNSSRTIHNVELAYSDKDPLSRDVTIRLVKDGIRLYFEPNSQLLRLIEVYDLSNISLRYCSTVFSKPGDEGDVSKVEACFGATHPGAYDKKQRLYELSWRGLSFSFTAHKETSTLQTSYVQGTGLGSLQFTNATPPLLAKMTIFKGSLASPKLPSTPSSAICGMCCPVSVRSTSDGRRLSGLTFSFLAQVPGPTVSRAPDLSMKQVELERIVSFGDTTEFVLSALGAPSKVYYASAEPMLIKKGADSERLRGPQPHFFFNYFTLGVDVCFDSTTNRVSKFVLHSNLPGHYDFGIYARCNFSITFGDEPLTLTPTSKRESFIDRFTEGTDMATQQVVLSRNEKKNRSDAENPFGSTVCYGTNQVIVEVCNRFLNSALSTVMSNGLIASLTLF